MEAGRLAKVSDELNKWDRDGWMLKDQFDSKCPAFRASLSTDLFRCLPLDSPIPDWWPPFDVKLSFILDEAAVWFCNLSFIGQQFDLSIPRVSRLCAIVWEAKIDIKAKEMSALLVAHGMPITMCKQFEEWFEVGITSLVSGRGREAIKKYRQPSAIQNRFSDVMRYWGR